MRSEAITDKIMTEVYSEVKTFMSEIIANHRKVDFGEIEEKVEELSRRFSKRVTDGALEALGNGYVGRTIECECGGELEYHSNLRWILTSVNGKVEIYRAYYYCKECRSSKVPLDEQLCLEGKHQSIGVRRQMALMAVSDPFEESVKRLGELTGVVVSSKEEQLESEEIGRDVGLQADGEVEAFWSEERDIEPEVTARRLYITADGTIVPTDEGGKEVKIGSVYETPLAKDAVASDIRYTGGFHNSEYFGKKLYILSLKRGLRTAIEMVFIGDGSKWIWNLARYHFPEAVQIVDWYHVEERIWDLSRALYGEGTKATDEWAHQQLDRLMEGKVEEIITSLSELSVSNADVAEKVDDNITYLTNNKDRMRYNEYEKKGYHIGSGTVESACKHVVGQRLKLAGMRWSVVGADAILQLRILWKNGEWRRFWESRKAPAAA